MSQFHAEQPDIPRLPKQPAQQERPAAVPRFRPLPRYKVILHPDNSSDLMYVVRSVMELTRFPRAEATHKMWEAHHCGRSVLLQTYLERAELLAEQFADKGLKVTVEPA
jgi:ATP-dependent Clp protease adaptor protein ClpS